jgi:hypothetical protein
LEPLAAPVEEQPAAEEVSAQEANLQENVPEEPQL